MDNSYRVNSKPLKEGEVRPDYRTVSRVKDIMEANQRAAKERLEKERLERVRGKGKSPQVRQGFEDAEMQIGHQRIKRDG